MFKNVKDMNAEFQELKKNYSLKSQINDRATILDQMKSNLLSRNNNQDLFEFQYTNNSQTVSISSATATECFAIDGDMNPRGL